METPPTMIYNRFLLEPIGVNGRLEAFEVHSFCSPGCRSEYTPEHPYSDGDEAVEVSFAITGTQCETCGLTIIPGQKR